ncbi:ABC transporter permease [Enterocloster lavalensis]|uniref:ABC transporter permease n=1 Tax=Enterocloster lavalensis TaxID=460384 RepID=UPI002A80CD4E|nr:ABC transporter permease [Enterocloster lavalensis]
MGNEKKHKAGVFLEKLLINNAVTILFCIICVAGIILAKQPLSFIVGEISTRLFRNLILILALLVPVWAGMGLNFSIVLGAMSAQIGIIVATNFSVSGFACLMVSFIVSIPLSLLFGNLTGRLFNQTKGQEMITGMILGFFAKGIYDLVFMFLCGPVIPIKNQTLLLTNGIGLTTPINLEADTKGAINKMWSMSLDQAIGWGLIVLLAVQAAVLAYKIGVKREKIRWAGQYKLYLTAALLAAFKVLCAASKTVLFALQFTDVPVVTAIMISTLLAGLGQLIFIQDIGNFTTYTAHENVGTFAIAALLVGGASIKKATIGQAVLGALLFHTMFIISPIAGKNLFDNAQLGEYFRVFACYAVIAVALALHAWKTVTAKRVDDSESEALEEKEAQRAA